MEEQDKASGLSRGKRMAIIFSMLVFFVIFFGASAAFLMEPGGTYYMLYKPSGLRIPITREQALATMAPMLGLCATAVVAVFWRSMRENWRTAQPDAVAPEIPYGETLLWFGKRSWRGIRGAHVLGSGPIKGIPKVATV